jgi:hypothetical protein
LAIAAIERNRDHGGKSEPKRRGCDGLQGAEARQAERRGQGRNRAQDGELQPGHSMPGGEARRQAAEGEVEQLLAAARAHEAGETLGRGQGERP